MERRSPGPRFNERVPLPFSTPLAATQLALDSRIQRLEQLASVGTLSAGLAHEIKNAMVAIRTFVEMLIAQNKDAELAGIVQREMVRIDSIVSQMLRFGATIRPSSAKFHPHEALDRCLRLFEPQLSARSIRLQQRFRAKAEMVEGDAHQLTQALINLFLNAIEAMGAGGELTVSTSVRCARSSPGQKKAEQSSIFRITIADTGPGIPQDQLSRIFEPFYTTKPNGTGLGLSITRQIIEQFRGTISVASTPGKGASFCIILPLAKEA